MLHADVVGHPIRLHSLGMNGGTLSQIEGTGLESHRVGAFSHFTAQRVDLVDQMPLGGTADGGIAGHIGDLIQG